MRFVKFCCAALLLVPFACTVPGCGGSDEAGVIATDEELLEYGKQSAPEGFKKALEGQLDQ